MLSLFGFGVGAWVQGPCLSWVAILSGSVFIFYFWGLGSGSGLGSRGWSGLGFSWWSVVSVMGVWWLKVLLFSQVGLC